MSEPSDIPNPVHGDPASSSGPVFIFNGPVYSFYNEANAQGNLVGCLMMGDPSSTSPSSKSVVSLFEFEFSQQSIGNARNEGLQDHQRRTPHSAHPLNVRQAENRDVPRGSSSSDPGLDQSFFDGNRDVQDARHIFFSASTG
jgi:hypothetical protein